MLDTNVKSPARPHEFVLNAFEQFERQAQGATPSWLQALHKGGISHFAELGFPTLKHEEWRFTNVAPVARTEWRLPDPNTRITEKELAPFLYEGLAGKRVVFVGGHGRSR